VDIWTNHRCSGRQVYLNTECMKSTKSWSLQCWITRLTMFSTSSDWLSSTTVIGVGVRDLATPSKVDVDSADTRWRRNLDWSIVTQKCSDLDRVVNSSLHTEERFHKFAELCVHLYSPQRQRNQTVLYRHGQRHCTYIATQAAYCSCNGAVRHRQSRRTP